MITKKISVFSVLLLLTVSLGWSKQRTESQIKSIARTTLFQKNSTTTLSSDFPAQTQSFRTLRSSSLMKRPDINTAHEVFYVVSPEEQKGFVLVSADDRMPQVLGVSDDGVFDEDNIPDGLYGLLSDYAEAQSLIESGKVAANTIFAPMADAATAEEHLNPLLGGILFNQSAPYNNTCPLRYTTSAHTTQARCVVGCVATAMAQVMDFWKYPTGYCKGSNAYTVNETNGTISVSCDFSKIKFDWDKILPTYATAYTAYTAAETDTTAEYITFSTFYHNNAVSKNEIIVDSLHGISVTSSFSGKVQFVITDKDGKFVQTAGPSTSIYNMTTLSTLTKTRTMKVSLPGTLADGEYRLYLGAKKAGTKKWSLVQRAPKWSDRRTTREPFYIKVTKTGNEFCLDGTVQPFAVEYTDENSAAVAELSFACGASVNMRYGRSSSANPAKIITAAQDYFGYDADMYYLSAKFCNAEVWNNSLKNELQTGRPILMYGSTASGSGHEFVFDGFRYEDGRPYFHVNWGWGGSSNGYFLTTLLKPSEAGIGGSTSDFANSNSAILGFKPEDNISETAMLGITSVTLDSDYSLPGKTISVYTNHIQGCSSIPVTGSLGLYLVDSLGNERLLATPATLSALKLTYYLTPETKTSNCALPSDLPYGDYTFALHIKENSNIGVHVGFIDTLHVVDHDPADAQTGLLRYNFDEATGTAVVKLFSDSHVSTANRYVGDITVPDSVSYKGHDYKVVGISDSTFYGCTGLTSITISDSVNSIGQFAFYGCTALESVVLPAKLTTVEREAFENCSALTSIVIPEGVESIEASAFSGCSALTTLQLPSTLTTLVSMAFQDCTSLLKLTIPEGVTTIPMKCFDGCTSMTDIIIPASMKSIVSRAFYNNTSLKSIHVHATIPPSLTTTALTNTNNCPIYVPSESYETYISTGNWVNYKERIVKEGPTGISDVQIQTRGLKNAVIFDINGKRIGAGQLQHNQVYVIDGVKTLYR